MSENAKLLQALNDGNVELLKYCLDDAAVKAESTQLALRRSAERVVSHRPNYHATLLEALELGIPCDVWTAARAGLLNEVQKTLLADGSLRDTRDGSGRTPLQRAALVYGACDECEQVVDFLLESGANVDIFTACTYGMLDIVRAELKRDPTLVSQRAEGATPLNWAVRPRRNYEAAPEICKILLGANADVHAPDEYECDMTPLHHAAEWGPKICLQLVDLLLDSGADINAKDGRDWTALQYAKDRGRKEMIRHLTELVAT